MASSVYLASAQGATGKSAVALGLLEQMTLRLGRVGVFRPVVLGPDTPGQPAPHDRVLDLLLDHDGVDLPYASCTGVTYDEVRRDPDAALGTIVDKYHAVAARCDAVVVVGSDYTDVPAPTEFAFNARVAANLSCPVVLVIGGAGRSAEHVVRIAESGAAELAVNMSRLLAVVANRIDPAELDHVREMLAGAMPAGVPVFALPDEPLLIAPTVMDLVAACGGEVAAGDASLLDRECERVVVAAMTLPNVLDRLVEGAVVVTPADRIDVYLGVLLAHGSATFPSLAALVLNGGFAVPAQIERLIAGLDSRLPVVTTPGGTFPTSVALARAEGRLSKSAPRKVEIASALFDRHVDARTLLDLLDVSASDVVTPLMFERTLLERARTGPRQRIVLPEGDDERILAAAQALARRDVADLVLVGDPAELARRATSTGVDLSGVTVIDPRNPQLRERFAVEYARRRAHKGVTLEAARDVVADVSFFGTLMVALGMADGMVSGAAHTTAQTIRPALQLIRTSPGVDTVSSVFFMCLPDRVVVYGDCAVVTEPTAAQLADIAVSAAGTAAAFGIHPVTAMLSYSSGVSGAGAEVDKVRAATELVRARRPDLVVDGPMQFDAAVDPGVARAKMPDSPVAGRATVFVFPDLNTGNNTYKAVQRTAGAVAIGPVLQGLRAPVNDLSRGASVRDIVNTVAITVIQAQTKGATLAG